MERRNNYDISKEQARVLFLNFDQEAICRRLNLPATETEIPIRFLGEQYSIRRSDGQILRVSDGSKANFSTVLSVYDMLTHSTGPVALKGEFVPITALNGVHGTQAVHDDLDGRGAAAFAGRMEELHRICRAWGGVPTQPGDVAYILPVFDWLPVCLRFWDADDEFPAALHFFWDANVRQYLHYETLWYIAGELTDRLVRKLKELEN